MDDAWKTLIDAGLPEGAVRRLSGGRFDDREVRAAIETIARAPSSIPAARREPLLAWLRAAERHWPDRFGAVAGAEGRSLSRALETGADPNRYLKLRRIAIENLSVLI